MGRSSEIITTYGPGSIFNGKQGLSVMILGLDAWPESKEQPEDVSKFKIEENKLVIFSDSKKYFLKNNEQFIGYKGDKENPTKRSIILLPC